MIIKLSSSLLAGFFLLIFTFPPAVYAQETNSSRIIQEYDNHRLAYKAAYASEQERFEKENNKVLANKGEIEKEIQNLERTKTGIQAAIMGKSIFQTVLHNIRLGISSALFPFPTAMLSTASKFSGISVEKTLKIGLPVVFILWAIVLFLVLRRYPRRNLLTKNVLRWLSILLFISLVLMSPSLFAEETLSKEEKLKTSLDLTTKVFSMSDHERYLGILISGNINNILLPELASGSEYLKVYRNIDTGTGEAYFTIAAIASYLGRNGEAIDALKRLSDPKIRSKPENRDYIITQTLKYLIQQNQTEAASDMLDANLSVLKNTVQIISLSEFLSEQGLQASAEKTLKRAISNAKTTEDLLELGNFLYSKGKQAEGIEAYVKASRYAQLPQQIVLVAKTWSGHGLTVPESFLTDLNEKYRKAGKSRDKTLLDYQLELVGVIYRNNRVENAVQLFSNILSSQQKTELKTYSQLLDFALANRWYEQATAVVRNLVRKLPSEQRFEVKLRPSVKLKTEEGLPDQTKLSLPDLYGMLNEEQGFDDKAITSYINSIQHSLNNIQISMGYEAKYNLNNFFLLGRQYKKSGNTEMLAALDATYTLLEEQRLAQLKLLNEDEIKNMQSIVDDEHSRIEELKQEIDRLKGRHKNTLWKTTFQTISLVGTFLFLIILLIGCIVWAIDYSRQQSSNKLSAFSAKFLEVFGWVKIYSILGALSGMLFVLVGQTWVIFQRKHEEFKALRIAAVRKKEAQNKTA